LPSSRTVPRRVSSAFAPADAAERVTARILYASGVAGVRSELSAESACESAQVRGEVSSFPASRRVGCRAMDSL
jgi:hypothetical protein